MHKNISLFYCTVLIKCLVNEALPINLLHKQTSNMRFIIPFLHFLILIYYCLFFASCSSKINKPIFFYRLDKKSFNKICPKLRMSDNIKIQTFYRFSKSPNFQMKSKENYSKRKKILNYNLHNLHLKFSICLHKLK